MSAPLQQVAFALLPASGTQVMAPTIPTQDDEEEEDAKVSYDKVMLT